MTFPFLDIMFSLGFFGYLFGAVISAIAALWMWKNGDRHRPDRKAGIGAAGMTALWCAVAVSMPASSLGVVLCEAGRNLAWIYLLLRLFAHDGRDQTMRPIRHLVMVLASVTLFQPLVFLSERQFVDTPGQIEIIWRISAILHILVAIGALVLLHNLYAGASKQARQILRWSTIALAGLWIYDLNLYTVTYLSGDMPPLLFVLRGILSAIMVCALALGASAQTLSFQLKPSRAVTFQSLSLMVIGAYLLAMSLISEGLASLGGEYARLTQVAFLALAMLAAILWLPSQRTRSWVRVTAIKHLFQHRYDYRAEWLRFTQSIGRGEAASDSFEERAVKVIGDITESPGGLLLVPNEEADLELAARWQWPTINVPARAADSRLAGLMEQHNFILDLDQLRAGVDHFGESACVPEWLREASDAWAVVPLLHFDRIVGAVVLARPEDSRQLDWEDFDLLRVVGQQLASYLAERSGQQALMEANRFDEFNRRIAFVMHDIKNLTSQLSLLARNAEKHVEKPEFRADMLLTLRNSSEKLNTLIDRLNRYGAPQSLDLRPLDLMEMGQRLVQRFAGQHPLTLVHGHPCKVRGDEEGMEQALIHLVQNAIDASSEDQPIFIEVCADESHGTIQIVDSGVGMSPSFVQNGLFKPFVSSKNSGFGIGAFEARELIRSMGGKLNVESREGMGTRFSLSVPLVKPAGAHSDGADEKRQNQTSGKAA